MSNSCGLARVRIPDWDQIPFSRHRPKKLSEPVKFSPENQVSLLFLHFLIKPGTLVMLAKSSNLACNNLNRTNLLPNFQDLKPLFYLRYCPSSLFYGTNAEKRTDCLTQFQHSGREFDDM
jgi:hypothetical protein